MSSPQPTEHPHRDPDPRELKEALERLAEAKVVLRIRIEHVERLLEAMR